MSEEEIKEKIKAYYVNNDIDKIIDSITNLQQENKQLKEEIKQYQKELEKADSITQSCIFQGKDTSEISFRNCLNKMTDYKTKIDKAIEILKAMKHCELLLGGKRKTNIDKLLEILKGDSNE